MDDSGVPEFERTVYQGYLVWVVLRQQIYRDLQVSEYFVGRLLRVNIEGLQTRILKFSVETLRYAHLLRLLCQKVLDPLHTVEHVAKFFPLADLIKFLLLALLNQVE